MSAWGAPLASATFYLVTCIGSTITQWTFSAMHFTNRLSYNQPCWCQLDHNCDKQTSTTTNVVDDAAYSSFSTRTTVVIGHKFSAVKRLNPKLLDRSKNAIFAYRTCVWRPVLGWSHRNYVQIFCIMKLESLAIVWHCLCGPMFSHFGTTRTCHRQTDRGRQTFSRTVLFSTVR